MRKTSTAMTAFIAIMAFAGSAHADTANANNADASNAAAAPASSASGSMLSNILSNIQVKLMGTAVLVNGHVDKVEGNAAGLIPGAIGQTSASNNLVPTVAVEYFFTPNISLETICCVTGHHVSATAGALAGKTLIDNAQVIPATFTLKYHLTNALPMGIKPYVGIGPSLFIWVNDRPSATVQGAGVTRTHLSDNIGGALQAGFDVPVAKGYSFTVDAKKYLMPTTATFYAGSVDAEQVKVHLDPWVVSAGIAYRF